MPTPECFTRIPPFPDDVPTVELQRVELRKLLSSGDAAESDALFEACTGLGFFRLDLRGCAEGESLLKETEAAFDVGREFYALSDEEKSRFPLLPSNLGYKPIGGTKIEDGRPDRCEIYSLPMDDLLALAPPTTSNHPPPFAKSRPLLTSCAKHMHSVAGTILTHLSAYLALPPRTLPSMHALTQRSPSNLRFLHMPPQQRGSAAQTSLMGHTDNGSVTVLFNVVGGLQILDGAADGWGYVRPEAGHAVINLGDSMVQLTGGVVRSNMHRVVPAPGAQSESPRFSIAYVLKPPYACRMERLKGEGIPCGEEGEEEEENVGTYEEFHAKKSKGIREGKNLVGSRGGKKTEKKVDVRVNEVMA
ncbi:MAG: hypothetical protein ASARMPRED_007367 [Alectoria sarmentosa]|nr:MAG: hypothetical protein ASARMPRED_007367 [Alectoria sarmentosa]